MPEYIEWKEMTIEEKQWADACAELSLQMLTATFVHLFRGSRLISLEPAVVEVRGPGQKEFLERNWAERVAEALKVERVEFILKGETDEEV